MAFLTRKALVQNTNVGSGADFGMIRTSAYPRITGMATIIGSMSIRIQSSIQENGPALISSLWIVSSGVNFLDAPNRGNYVAVDVTAANSQVASLLLVGEVLR